MKRNEEESPAIPAVHSLAALKSNSTGILTVNELVKNCKHWLCPFVLCNIIMQCSKKPYHGPLASYMINTRQVQHILNMSHVKVQECWIHCIWPTVEILKNVFSIHLIAHPAKYPTYCENFMQPAVVQVHIHVSVCFFIFLWWVNVLWLETLSDLTAATRLVIQCKVKGLSTSV